MEKIKNTFNLLAVLFGISFVDGFLGLNLSDSFYVLLGLGEAILIVRLLILVNKDMKNK